MSCHDSPVTTVSESSWHATATIPSAPEVMTGIADCTCTGTKFENKNIHFREIEFAENKHRISKHFVHKVERRRIQRTYCRDYNWWRPSLSVSEDNDGDGRPRPATFHLEQARTGWGRVG